MFRNHDDLQGYDCMVKANGKLEKEVLSLEVCFYPSS